MTAPNTTDLKADLRQRIRAWMNRLEAAHYGDKALILTLAECGKLDQDFRCIQDIAAKVLGYE